MLADWFSYVTDSIKQGTVEQDPFAYVQSANFFPLEIYQQIIRSIPDQKFFTESIVGYENRKVFPLQEEFVDKLDHEIQPIWQDIAFGLGSSDFMHVLLEKFKTEIDERFKHSERPKLVTELSLCWDEFGFELGPRSEVSRKIVSLKIFLPEDEQLRTFGVVLCKPTDTRSRRRDLGECFWDNFEYVKEISFLPNTCLVYPVTRNSFVGVSRLESLQPRLSLQLDLCFEQDRDVLGFFSETTGSSQDKHELI